MSSLIITPTEKRENPLPKTQILEKKVKSAPAVLLNTKPRNKETLFQKLPDELLFSILRNNINLRDFSRLNKELKLRMGKNSVMEINSKSINNNAFLDQFYKVSYKENSPEIRKNIKKLLEYNNLDIHPPDTITEKYITDILDLYDKKISLYVSVLRFYDYFEEIIKTAESMYKFCSEYIKYKHNISYFFISSTLYNHMYRCAIIMREISLLYLKMIVNRKHTSTNFKRKLSIPLQYLSIWYPPITILPSADDNYIMRRCYKTKDHLNNNSRSILKKYNIQYLFYYFLKYYCSDHQSADAYIPFLSAVYNTQLLKPELSHLLDLTEERLTAILAFGQETVFLTEAEITTIYKKCVEFINNEPNSGFKLDFTEYGSNFKVFADL